MRVFGLVLPGLTTVALLCSTPARAQGVADDVLLGRVGEYIQQYYTRAQNVVGRETITVQPLAGDLSADGHGRRLVYDFHLEWSHPSGGPAVASVVRQLLTVDGRAPRAGDEPQCLDPRPVTPEPLAMLLPDRRGNYLFSWTGPGRVDGRRGRVLSYRSRAPEPADVSWKDDCANVDLPGRTRGKIWVDTSSGEVLRFDEGIVGLFEFPVPRKQQRAGAPAWMVIERADSSIKYKPVRFQDPDETLLLPAAIDTVTVVRNAGVPRVRVTQAYSNYRRFVTEGRVLE